MIFNDQNKLTGFTIPIKDKDKLKKKFDIEGDFWITKSGDGYYMAVIAIGCCTIGTTNRLSLSVSGTNESVTLPCFLCK